jgi:hypothetical protein
MLRAAGDDEACAACETEHPTKPMLTPAAGPSALDQERQALLARAAELRAERDTCQAAAAEAAALRDAAAGRAAEIEAQLKGGLPARRQQLQQEREVGECTCGAATAAAQDRGFAQVCNGPFGRNSTRRKQYVGDVGTSSGAWH